MFKIIRRKLHNYQVKKAISKWKISSDNPIKIEGTIPDILNQGTLVIGQQVTFRSYRLNHRVRVLPEAQLKIGDKTFLNDAVTICATKNISIGKYNKIGDQVHIYDSDFHEVTPISGVLQESIVIGDNVWIGAKSMILAGTKIGNNSVIAAGSVVKGEIPANCVAAGAPAKVLKYFDVPDGWIRK